MYQLDEKSLKNTSRLLKRTFRRKEETEIPDELWSNEPLSSMPGQPPAEVDLHADKVEEKRLKKRSVAGSS